MEEIKMTLLTDKETLKALKDMNYLSVFKTGKKEGIKSERKRENKIRKNMKDFLKFRFQFGQISQMEIDIINKELNKQINSEDKT